jgi:quinol monooxygenase YgiN
MSTSNKLVVIFRARHRPDIGDDYLPTTLALKDKALAEYRCEEFVYATTPDGDEIAISFWPDRASIEAWRQDPQHHAAQRLNARWYASYLIQVGVISREYGRDDGRASHA